MIIIDLDCWENVANINITAGGSYTITNVNTLAAYGLAYADTNAIAVGAQTGTYTHNYTNTYVGPYGALSTALGTAIASASSPNTGYAISQTNGYAVFSSGRPY